MIDCDFILIESITWFTELNIYFYSTYSEPAIFFYIGIGIDFSYICRYSRQHTNALYLL